jgi:hypothetical protein
MDARPVAIAVLLGTVAGAQGPTREPPVRIPGTGVVLGDGWTLVYTNGAAWRCMYAVPTSWVVSPRGWKAADADGVSHLEVAALADSRWAAHRNAVEAAMPAAALREDSPRRFRIEQLDGARLREHIEESDGAHVCAADIDIGRTDRLQQVAQKIASTVHVAHESDLQWMKKH